MDKIRRISKQNKILVVTALFVIGLLFVLPIALIKNSETMKRSSVIDGENDLKSQVLVYGKDYQLHYEKEQEIKEKMEKRAEILEKKHEEEKKLDVPPKTAQEVLEKINEEQGKIENNDKKDNMELVAGLRLSLVWELVRSFLNVRKLLQGSLNLQLKNRFLSPLRFVAPRQRNRKFTLLAGVVPVAPLARKGRPLLVQCRA